MLGGAVGRRDAGFVQLSGHGGLRRAWRRRAGKGLGGNRYVWYAIGILLVIQLGFTYLAAMQILFATTAMSVEAWLRVIVVASSVLFLGELEKFLFRTFTKMERSTP